MFDGVKGLFVKALGDGADPKSIPKHYVAYYDKCVEMYRKFGHFQGAEDIPYNDWPIICFLADLERRQAELENSRSGVGVSREDAQSPRRADFQAKEGRASKEGVTAGAA